MKKFWTRGKKGCYLRRNAPGSAVLVALFKHDHSGEPHVAEGITDGGTLQRLEKDGLIEKSPQMWNVTEFERYDLTQKGKAYKP